MYVHYLEKLNASGKDPSHISCAQDSQSCGISYRIGHFILKRGAITMINQLLPFLLPETVLLLVFVFVFLRERLLVFVLIRIILTLFLFLSSSRCIGASLSRR